MLKRLLLMALCVTLAVGAPLAAAIVAEQPCALPEASGDASPCGGCESSQASGCALACGIASSCPALTPSAMPSGFSAGTDPVAGRPSAHFPSRAGPPGLQPPR